MSCKSLCSQIENNYRLQCKDIQNIRKLQILRKLFSINMYMQYIAF